MLVHSADLNPCEYAIATLHGRDIRDDDLARPFARIIRRKISKSKGTNEWPLSPEDMISMLDKGPLPDLYNAILYTKSFISDEVSPKQAVMGLVVHGSWFRQKCSENFP